MYLSFYVEMNPLRLLLLFRLTLSFIRSIGSSRTYYLVHDLRPCIARPDLGVHWSLPLRKRVRSGIENSNNSLLVVFVNNKITSRTTIP